MNTIEFKNLSEWWLVIIPVMAVVVLRLGMNKKNRILSMMGLDHNRPLMVFRIILTVIGLGLVYTALLGPQVETGVSEIKGQGLDIYILMDTSKSMLATDVIPSRIDRSKKVVEELVTELKGDRIGFIPYASSAYIQMPLTDDYTMAEMFLNVIDTELIGGGGTDVMQALNLAVDSFGQSGSVNQVIVLLSDGEEADVDVKAIKQVLNESDIKVFTVGVGTEEGSLIPVYSSDGSTVVDYKKDSQGNHVLTRLDETLLKSIAAESGGAYYRSDLSLSEVSRLSKVLSGLETEETSAKKVKIYKQLFQWFLGFGLICLLIAVKLPDRPSGSLGNNSSVMGVRRSES